jgi:hypothetical protein
MLGAPVPLQSEIPRAELKNLVSEARKLVKRVRQAILKARSLRRAAARVESTPRLREAPHHAGAAAEAKPPEGNRLRDKAGEVNIIASKLLGQLLKVKGRMEISLLSPDPRYGPFHEALIGLNFATDAPPSNRWLAGVSFDEESVLDALDRFEMLLDVAPGVSDEIALSPTLRNGRYCNQVIDEIRKIRHLYPASTVAQIRSDHPNFIVWPMIDGPDMDDEDREIFFQPGRWGPVVGYATGLLARHFGKSEETIKRWRKAYKRHARTVPDRMTQKTSPDLDPV